MKKLILFGLICVTTSLLMPLSAQINLKGKLKNATNNRANDRVDRGIDNGLNKVEDGVKNLFKKKKKTEVDGQQEQAAEAKSAPQAQDAKPAADTKLSFQSYSKYDFIPGEKVILFEDLSQDAIGDFPALWNTNGSGEVQTTNLYPGKWLAMRAASELMPETKLTFTGNYTIEFDMILGTDAENSMNEHLRIALLKTNSNWKIGDFMEDCVSLDFNTHDVSGFCRKGGQGFFDVPAKEIKTFTKENDYSKPVRVSLWIQNQRLRCYLNENKILDLPRVIPANTTYNALQYRFDYDGSGTSMISNVRIAQGLPDTRNKLLTEGKLVTYGIYFDVNKDVVKPESYGTLKEIASILNEVPDVKVKIVGHTDSDGDDAKNMDLSKRRAASVKAELAKTFGVNADRLVNDGMGETQPVAPNDTPANKALNRRVEFIKL
jgi:outer membrane protein OmpA-like peptidoglycan-associated protein